MRHLLAVPDRTPQLVTEWGDSVQVMVTVNDPEMIFLGVYDDDAKTEAVAALTADEADRLTQDLIFHLRHQFGRES